MIKQLHSKSNSKVFLRKLFPTLLSLGKPRRLELSVMKNMLLYQQQSKHRYSLLQLSRSENFWKRHSIQTTDISLLRDPYFAKNAKF